MNLKETIRKVLKEETLPDYYKPAISLLLDNIIMPQYKGIIKKYDVFTPDEHEIQKNKFSNGKKSNYYIVVLHLIGGPNSKYWPRTQAVNDKYERTVDEVQDQIMNFIGIYVIMKYIVNSNE